MNLLVRIVAHRFFAVLAIIALGLGLLVIPAFTGGLGANPVEKLLHQTGEIAIWTLGAVLALSPLRVLFPGVRLVNALNSHRRAIGVSACIYGLLHFTAHLLYEGDWASIQSSFTKPFIWLGAAGLLMLIPLALTSNQWSIRRLGGKRWKRLHRLAYFAAGVLIIHQSIAGKGHWPIARWLLLTLGGLELARVVKKQLQRPASAKPIEGRGSRASG